MPPNIKNLYYRQHYLEPGLEAIVKYAWIMRAYEPESEPDLLIPDGYPEIIFVQQGAYRKAFLTTKQVPVVIDRSCVVGIQTQSVLARRLNNCQLIGLKLNPAGAHALFGLRLKNSLDTNQSLDLFDLDWLPELDQNLRACQEEDAIINLISDTFLHQVKRLPEDPAKSLAAAILADILAVKGQISVQQLAQQHHLSVRHFQRKFKSCFGITPKKFINIIRFKELYKSSVLTENPALNYLEHGYYDQMHFIKDFKKHLGINPSRRAASNFIQMNEIAKSSS